MLTSDAIGIGILIFILDPDARTIVKDVYMWKHVLFKSQIYDSINQNPLGNTIRSN